jgi:redox-regulated HSP33 family molecular chaperone
MLDMDELSAMSHTRQDLVCHYCNSVYEIYPAEIAGILREKKIKMN